MSSSGVQRNKRILFASYHGYIDPSSGAAVSVRGLLTQLARRGWDVLTYCGPLLDFDRDENVRQILADELDLSGLTNLNVMNNTPDSRDFYKVSRVVLMPSLWRESFGRVAAEAMINGIPSLASNRGALPEVVGDAAFLFEIPDRYTPETRKVPTAEEVAPWVETIIRLWDDEQFYTEASRRCRDRAEMWRPKVLLPRYEEVFQNLLDSR